MTVGKVSRNDEFSRTCLTFDLPQGLKQHEDIFIHKFKQLFFAFRGRRPTTVVASHHQMCTSLVLPLVIAKLPPQPLMRLLIIRIVLILAAIVIIVHLLRALAGMALRLLPVNVVGALGLGKAVDFETCQAGQHFFGEAVGDLFA
jgi:hypothetical protein